MSTYKDANIQFTTFSKDMSRFAYNRFLAIIGLLFVITSGLFLLVSYWLLTGSEYVENIMDNIGFQFDYINIKNSIYEQVGLIKEKLSLYMCGNSKNIVVKQEKLPDLVESFYLSSDNDSDNDVEDITQLIKELRKPPIPIDLTRSDDSDDNSSSSIESNNTSDEDYVDENSDEESVDDEHIDTTNDDTNDDTNNNEE